MSRNQYVSRRRILLAATGHIDREAPARSEAPRSEPFHQHIRRIPPIHPAYWSFTIAGMGERPLILSYEEVLALPAVDVTCTLMCSGNGSPRTATATWRGVPIKTLLDRLNIPAQHARFVSADGYSTGLPLDKLTNALLVYAINGEALSHEHGFPARLVVPGLYGYKMPKWITRMELTDTPAVGFWEARGWSADGAAQTTVAILSPHHREAVSGVVTIRGTAFAGEQDISHIEVNIDNGPWMSVPFTPGARYCLTEWQIDWSPPAPGDYHIQVRAWDVASQNDNPARQGIVVRVLEV